MKPLRPFRAVLLLLSLAGVTACDAVSLQPLVDGRDRVDGSAAVGAWRNRGDQEPTLHIRPGVDGTLRAVVDGVPFDVVVGRVGKHTWVDAQVAAEGDAVKPLLDWVIRPHLCARVELEGDTLRLWMVDGDWLDAALKKGTLKLPHQRMDERRAGGQPGTVERLVITADTDALRKAVMRFQDTPGAFRKDPEVFLRVK